MRTRSTLTGANSPLRMPAKAHASLQYGQLDADKWAHLDSNQGPSPYEGAALTTELWAPATPFCNMRASIALYGAVPSSVNWGGRRRESLCKLTRRRAGRLTLAWYHAASAAATNLLRGGSGSPRRSPQGVSCVASFAFIPASLYRRLFWVRPGLQGGSASFSVERGPG